MLMELDHWSRAMKWCRTRRVSPGDVYWWKRAMEATAHD